MDQGTNQTRVGYESTRDWIRFDQHYGTKCPELGTKRLGYEILSFPILPETCAKTIGQNVKHSIKAPCICCRMMIHL